VKKQAKKAKKAAYRVPKGPSVGQHVERLTYDINAGAKVEMTSAIDGAVATTAGSYLYVSTGPNVAACMIALNQVPRDASSSGRIGRHFLMRSIHIRANLDCSASDNVTLYLIEVRNRYVGTDMPTMTSIFNSQTSGTLTKIDGASRYRMIRRWNYSLDPNMQRFAQLDTLVPLNVLTSYTQADSTGTFANITDGALILVAMGQRGIASSATLIGVHTRIYYSDQ